MIISDERIEALTRRAADCTFGSLSDEEPIEEAIRTAIRETTEACAKICDDYATVLGESQLAKTAELQAIVARQCARAISAAIRAA